MTNFQLISSLQVAVGALIMVATIIFSLKIRAKVLPSLRGKWLTLVLLMAFFLIGYLLFILNLMTGEPLPLEMITGTIFMGGSLFVYLVINVSKGTIRDIEEKRTALEQEIRDRHQRAQERARYESGLEMLSQNTRELILAAGDSDLFYRQLCTCLHRQFKADLVLLPILNQGGSNFTYREAAGVQAERVAGKCIPILEGGLCGLIFKNGETLCIPDLRKEPRANQAMAKELGVTSGLIAPLWHEDKVVGGLSIFRNEVPFDDIDSQLMDLFSQRTSIAYQNMHLLQTLENRVNDRTTELEQKNKLLEKIISNIPSYVFWFNEKAEYHGCNERFSHLLGLSEPGQIFGHDNLPLPWDEGQSEHFYAKVKALLTTGATPINREIFGTNRSGDPAVYNKHLIPLKNTQGDSTGVLGIVDDITARKRAEEALREQQRNLDFLAHHDPLTGLPNRLLLQDRLHLAMAKSRESGQQLALFFLDLDHFKVINDSLGHEAGDLLLQEVAERLKTCLRETDTVARMGGDEFVVILEQIGELEQVLAVARKILSHLAKTFHLTGYDLAITASIGISIYPGDALDLEGLMKTADLAMYQAKETGRNTYRFYTAEMNANVQRRLQFENSMRKALDNEDLVLHYQPQVDLTTGSLIGMEALVRWQPPGKGLIPPNEFIALAEETGLIVPLGQWVLSTACRQNVLWQRQGLPPQRIAVNISARQFQKPNFVANIAQTLKESGLDPQWLELEITESCAMENVDTNIRTMAEIRKLGVHLAIDDFGTGYSSLSHLKRFPVSRLKIDRSFVRDACRNEHDAAITTAIVALGQNMGIEVMAEGIEDLAQVEFLRGRGCRGGQGFLFSRPVTRETMEKIIQGGRIPLPSPEKILTEWAS